MPHLLLYSHRCENMVQMWHLPRLLQVCSRVNICLHYICVVQIWWKSIFSCSVYKENINLSSSGVFPQSSPYQCCDALHIASHDRFALEAIVKMERFLTNYEAPPCQKGKAAETESTSKQESSKIYESTQRKRTFNPSWKASFPWLVQWHSTVSLRHVHKWMGNEHFVGFFLK